MNNYTEEYSNWRSSLVYSCLDKDPERINKLLNTPHYESLLLDQDTINFCWAMICEWNYNHENKMNLPGSIEILLNKGLTYNHEFEQTKQTDVQPLLVRIVRCNEHFLSPIQRAVALRLLLSRGVDSIGLDEQLLNAAGYDFPYTADEDDNTVVVQAVLDNINSRNIVKNAINTVSPRYQSLLINWLVQS